MPTSIPASGSERRRRSPLRDLWRRFRRNRAATAGLGVVGGLIVVALGFIFVVTR